MSNNFDIFASGPKTNFNACVGFNGSPDTYDYEDGYFVAAEKIIQQTIAEYPKIPVDIVIYPIIFCIRHAIELSLKAQMVSLLELKVYRPEIDLPPDILAGHDLSNLWKVFRINASVADRRYLPGIERIDGMVEQFAGIDPSGQVFRYPSDLKRRRRHLKDHSLINVERVQLALKELGKVLMDLRHLTMALEDEFALGTWTKNLSRADIEEISNKLPKRSDWDSAYFDEMKDLIKRKYGLSSTEFSSALNIIQKHYRFCVNIDQEIPLEAISAGELKSLISTYKERGKLYGEAPSEEISDGLRVSNFDDIMTHHAEKSADGTLDRMRQLVQGCIDKVSEDSIRTFNAVYYLGRDGGSCEQFGDFLRLSLVKTKEELLSRLFGKTNLEKGIEKGLRELGQTSLLMTLSSDETS